MKKEKIDILGFSDLMRLLQNTETTLNEVKKMVEDGADVKYQAPCGETPLTIAHRYAPYSVVKYLIEQGADPEHALYQVRKTHKEELEVASLPKLEEEEQDSGIESVMSWTPSTIKRKGV